jgi:hypothetical protein
LGGGRAYLGRSLGQIHGSLSDLVVAGSRHFAEARDIVFKAFCPTDFGGANFSVPWTTRKAVFSMHWDFFTGFGGERKGEGMGFRASISEIDERVIGWTIRAKII